MIEQKSFLTTEALPGVVQAAVDAAVAAVGSGGGGGPIAIDDVTGLQSALDGKQLAAAVLTATTAAFTTAQEDKLAGISDGATANATDAALRDRATHTGTQAASTISGLAAVAKSGAIADVTGLQAALNLKANVSDVLTGLAGKADVSALAGKADVADLALKANITDVTAGLAGKADTAHTHDFAELTAKPTTLAGFGITDDVEQPVLKPSAGDWIANGWRASGATLVTNNHIQGFWVVPFDITVTDVAVDVTTAAAGGTAKVTIYDSYTTCKPRDLLAESPSIDVSTAGVKPITLTTPVVLQKGQVIWLGVRSSGAANLGIGTMSGSQTSGMMLMASPTIGNRSSVSRSATYASPTQSPWVWNTSEIGGTGCPLIFMKAQ